MTYVSLQDLRDARRRMVDGLRENKAEDGFRTLLANLYPDNAHFIYELLQNAEDAKAGVVEFDLRRNHLTVTHDGKRPFTLADVEAITGIGQSTKVDDLTQIGKFGVGFKAVFAYTNRPEIRSGLLSFAIEDLFVPEASEGVAPGGRTTFTFPFDRPEKPASTAFDEIARGLDELADSTVLFLGNVHTVKYRISGGSSGAVSRADLQYPRTTITSTKSGTSSVTEWIRLVGSTGVNAAAGHIVAAAFRLVEEGQKPAEKPKPGPASKAATRLLVAPIDHADTCIYFPAAKETSGLKFHIHAPFASTVARDSVRETPENAQLIDAIGRLVAGALPVLLEGGWLTDGFLAALPNSNDQLIEPYDSIRNRIVGAFEKQPVTPRIRGGFGPAAELVRSPSEFRTALTEGDIKFLTSLVDGVWPEEPRWIPDRDGRAGTFLDDLNAIEFGWEELGAAFEGAPVYADDDYAHEEPDFTDWAAWLEPKTTDWLRRFLELLGRGIEDYSLRNRWGGGPLDDFEGPIILVRATGGGTALVPARGVFLPAEPDDDSEGRVVPDLAYFDADEQTRGKARLAAFYQTVGVRRYDERAVVEGRLQRYRDEDFPERDGDHFADLRLFIEFLDHNPRQVALFSGAHLFRVDWSDGKYRLALPSKVYVDEPYRATGLSILFPQLADEPYRLSNTYFGKVAGIAEFVGALGGKIGLTIAKASVWHNPERRPEWYTTGTRDTAQGTKVDWSLPEISEVLASGDPRLLHALWDLLCATHTNYANAVFQLNGSSTRHVLASQLAQSLIGQPWVLDRQGVIRAPEKMTVEDLPEGWAEPPANSIIMALNFGAEARVRDDQTEELARMLGVPTDAASRLRAEMDDLPEEKREAALEDVLSTFAAKRIERANFPRSASSDPDHRAAIVGTDAQAAPDHETATRDRSVVVGAGETSALARRYLREQYTSAEGTMYCQACHDAMPFKVGGEWYFETVLFARKRAKQHHQNALALCPLCAALYKHARATEDDKLIGTLVAETIDTESERVEVPVILDGKRRELWLTGKHALDLRTVLSVAGEAREADRD